ncbi:hypothetical protein C1645_841777 [Glomus cerebriforme]|uniref:Uncharacterized protein n=1 Tax=Glomus cerebriforme TaxID=658196 RepID=A0A397S9L5_9GLOM|nr:hypothetical protein C1645_841777 [Glomus cerebriforme]
MDNLSPFICICGKIIKFNRHYEEDYLNHHAKSSGCKAKKGQRMIFNFYKPAVQVEDMESSEEEFDSNVYDNMDDDDILRVDEGFQSEQISLYIKHISAQFGSSRRVELIACELFPKFLGKNEVLSKKLNYEEKKKLNRTLYAESVWQIDRVYNSVCSKTCTGYAEYVPLPDNVKFIPKFYWKDNALKNYLKNNHLHDI